jgi:hypothetical protein
MKIQAPMLRNSLFLLAALLTLPAFRAGAQNKQASATAAQNAAIPARITQAIDETQLTRLKGNVHPLARPEFDQGAVSNATPMSRMLMLLKRSPEQDAALQKLMGEQQSKDSPNFHQWLTPDQFGKQFGPADADIQAVTDWLTRQGFQGIKVGAGRTTIEFSGNVNQVRNAFHTEIHRYLVNGEDRQANVSDPQLPAALTPVVAGVVSLHNFPRKSMKHIVGAFTRTADGRVIPQFTTSGGSYVVGPADFAKIYNIPASLNGTGQQIAIVADSNINPQDVTDFRNVFGLPANPPNIILNGPDPGLNADEGEADLDVQISGMVAPNATIDLVVSQDTQTAFGIDLSALYIVDNNLAPIMSESFGACESGLGTAGNAFYNSLWQQAAAQGITVMVAAGDPGSAGCDDFTTAKVAAKGLAISGIASTPFNVAVGGTDFDDVGSQTSFWNTNANNAAVTRESALGYIPETTWNTSCAATATSAILNTVCVNPTPTSLLNIVGGSGGPSGSNAGAFAGYLKPSWQTGPGVPADGKRDTPDVSLFASNGPQSKSFYLLCQADGISAGSPPSCVPDSSGHFSFFGSGGTSASSPAFAGIMALINQSQANAGKPGRQGNANFVLYKIAQTASNSCNSSSRTDPTVPAPAGCVFNDVTKGNNSVPCAGASPNCSSSTANTNGVLVSPASLTTPAWTTTTGYDLATGLGSVNVTNLAAAWATAVGNFKASNTALQINGSTTPPTITHGTAVTAAVTVTAGTGGTPSGDVSLVAPSVTVNGGIGNATLSGGAINITNVILPGGSYSVTAHYAGDGTFSPSDSAGVPVVVNKENSRLQYGIVTFASNGAVASTNATSIVYGSPYILRMDILNSSTNACQPLVTNGVTTGCAFDATGTVTITDNGSRLDTGTFTINSAGHAEDQPIQLSGGTHALAATYSGDISYNSVTVPVADTVTVSQATTTTVLTPGATTVQANQGITLSVAISSQSNSTLGPTGNVTFKDGTATIGTATLTPAGATATAGASATAILNTSFATKGTHTLTAVYAGDQNYATSTSTGVTVSVGLLTTISVTSSATSIASGGSATLTATVATTSHGAGPTGTVQFMNGTSALSTAVTCTPTAGTSTTTASCTATLTTTLAFLAPPSTPNRVPNIRFHPVVLVAFVLLLLILIILRRIPAAYRRGYEFAALLLLVGLVASLAGCGSGYGGGGGGGVHYDSITAVYAGDASYAGSTSQAITITVQ